MIPLASTLYAYASSETGVAMLLGYSIGVTLLVIHQTRDSWRVFKCALITTSIMRYCAQHMSNMCTISLIDSEFAKKEISKVHNYLVDFHEMSEDEVLRQTEDKLLRRFRRDVEGQFETTSSSAHITQA